MSSDRAGGAPQLDQSVWSEDDAEELYEDAPCGYLTTSLDGTIRRVNRTLLSWTGYDVDDLVDRRRFHDLLPVGAKIYYETHYAPLLQMQGTVREIALELVRADASRLPALINAALKRDSSGRALAVRITVFDASDRRRYERELLHARTDAETRAAAATALEHVTEGVVLVDHDRRIRLLNPAAERILGASIEDVRGSTLAAIAPDWDAVEARIPVGAGAEPSPRPVIVPLELDGGTRWLAAAGESAPEGIVYTLRDVTEERRLAELRDDIVAIVSHELRTPLAGVYGAAQTLSSLGDRLDEEQRRQLVEVIGEQSGRLTRIVDQILLTERLDQGNVAVQRRSFDVAQEVARIVAGTQLWRAVRPVTVAAEESVAAEGDPALFEQALVSLLDNAIKYSPEGSEVGVGVKRARGSARVTVTDTGPGVPAAARGRIFEKFSRLDPQQATGTSGTGLGLYIARELVHRMQGQLDLLDSGGGTTFFIDLPLARADLGSSV